MRKAGVTTCFFYFCTNSVKMEKTSFLLFVFMWLGINLSAQITINRNDMPNTGDSLIYTETLAPFGIDYTATGPGYTWDFSSLGNGLQQADVYVSVSSTPLIYQAVFNWPIWNPPASIASPDEDVTVIPGVDFSDYYDYYKEQNSSFTSVGFGVTINNIPVPVKYSGAEMLYKFPLSANSLADSSVSTFSLSIPDLGYYETYRKRVNQVDGWGMLTTPFGTFETLRMKSTLYTRDSIYLDSIQTGIPVTRSITEYKWLGKAFGRPLLIISKEGYLPARAEYLSKELIALSVNAGPDITITQGEEVELNAVVTGGTPPYAIVWSNGSVGSTTTVSPSVTTNFSVNVFDSSFQFANDEVTVTVIPALLVQNIQLSSGWMGLSSYLLPQSTSVTEILSPIIDRVIVLRNETGEFDPVNNVNTLGEWDRTSGYFIKLSEGAMLPFYGYLSSERTIQLTAGWNLVPMLRECEISSSNLASQIASYLEIITEVAGTKVYWPEKLVLTLETFVPGKAYWIKVNADCPIVFPACQY